MGKPETLRTNAEWLDALHSKDPEYEAALHDLRLLLVNGLKVGLAGRM